MLVQHLITYPVRVFTHLCQRRIGQVGAAVFAGVRHFLAVEVVGGDVVQQRRQRTIARAMLKLLETPPAGELITG